jgi:hypothetical protein
MRPVAPLLDHNSPTLAFQKKWLGSGGKHAVSGRLTAEGSRRHAGAMSITLPHFDSNPYAPPLVDPAGDWPLLPVERWGELHLAAKIVSQRAMERVVRITGSLDAEIYYDARLIGEQVYVNGRLRGQSSVWHWSLVAPTIDFLVEGNQFRVPAQVAAGVGFSWRSFVCIRRFQLWVAGRVVYAE